MKTKFEAGSFHYGNGFIRSIARYQQVDAGWKIEMVLASASKVYDSPQEASMLAKMDVDGALLKAQSSGGTKSVDFFLASLGYNRVEGKDA